MWAVWALIGTFPFQPPRPQEVVAVWPQEHFLSLGWCWSFSTISSNSAESLTYGAGEFFYLFPFNTLVVRDTIGFESISIILFELWHYAKFFFFKTEFKV